MKRFFFLSMILCAAFDAWPACAHERAEHGYYTGGSFGYGSYSISGDNADSASGAYTVPGSSAYSVSGSDAASVSNKKPQPGRHALIPVYTPQNRADDWVTGGSVYK